MVERGKALSEVANKKKRYLYPSSHAADVQVNIRICLRDRKATQEVGSNGSLLGHGRALDGDSNCAVVGMSVGKEGGESTVTGPQKMKLAEKKNKENVQSKGKPAQGAQRHSACGCMWWGLSW
jgi:hypothetical protein